MRRINDVFEDKEFEELKAKKGTRTWREFILELANVKKRS